MKTYYAKRDAYDNVVGYTEVNETPAPPMELILMIPTLILTLIGLSPIWYFVTKSMLKTTPHGTKKYNRLYKINKLSKRVFIFQISMMIISALVMGFILIGHYLDFLNFIDFGFISS